MNLSKANIDDIDLLIKVRLDHLAESKGSLTKAEEQAFKQQLQRYFAKSIVSGQCIGMIAAIDNVPACAACLVITERPAGKNFPTGRIGTLTNVFTYPQYRRKGLATKVVTSLIQEARQAELSFIDLIATNEGKPLYEKIGFTVPELTAMRLKL